MGELKLKEREIVIPGDILAIGMDLLPANGTIREEDKIIATRLGLLGVSGRFVRVIPLTGRYIPKERDIIIGKVVDIGFSGWRIDIGWAFEANLSIQEGSSDFIERKADLTQYYSYGDVICAQITYVSGSKIIDLTTKGPGLRKLRGGKIIEVNPSKVPRIIGKQGSMISLIKEKTGCKIMVGQNGKVWILGNDPESEMLATKTIHKIVEESHLSGLTDRISKFLEKK